MTCIPPDDSTEPVDIDDGTQIDQNKKEKKSEFFIFIFCSIHSTQPPCSLAHDDNDEPPTPLVYIAEVGMVKWVQPGR
jgi:hypothetical protein